VPKTQGKAKVLNLSDKVKMLDLWKGGMFLEGGRHCGKNESSICSTALHSLHLCILSMHDFFSLQWSPWNQISMDTKGLLYTLNS
jgi:hypothetical protein